MLEQVFISINHNVYAHSRQKDHNPGQQMWGLPADAPPKDPWSPAMARVAPWKVVPSDRRAAGLTPLSSQGAAVGFAGKRVPTKG